jgi:hypothetical protein
MMLISYFKGGFDTGQITIVPIGSLCRTVSQPLKVNSSKCPQVYATRLTLGQVRLECGESQSV